MRPFFLTLLLILGLSPRLHSQAACTGLCQQQVSCPNGGLTTITGKILAPNGVDPLPNVLVYIPNAPVAAFPAGLTCPAVGAPPLGSPLVGATSAVDGTFTIANVPIGTAIPLVAVTGKWRRQTTVNTSGNSCSNTAVDPNSTRMPRNQAEGDIPRFAIPTGSADNVECVMLKVGIDQAEFTNPAGPGRISMFVGSGSPGSTIPSTAAAPIVSQESLMSDPTNLAKYDVLMLPCQGNANRQASGSTTATLTLPSVNISSNDLPNLAAFADGGGRIYSSHYSALWFYLNPEYANVAKWTDGASTTPTDPNPGGPNATVDTTFSEGATLAKWLPLVGASTTPNQIEVFTLRQDTNGVNPPTQAWLRLNNLASTVMQFVWNTPVVSTNQCGRILYNEYHVENPITPAPANAKIFPNECNLTVPMTPQEKLLEFSLFDLTNDGGGATLTPTTENFGNQNIGSTSAPFAFTFTNNSIFAATVTSVVPSPGFTLANNGCATIAPGSSCQISAAFAPTATGPATGTLTVNSPGSSLIATLMGNGVDFSLALNPTSGQAIAGLGSGTVATITPIAGFAFPVSLVCTTNAPASVCTPALSSFAPNGPTMVNLTITTTAEYAVIGYTGFGSSNLLLTLVALVSSALLWFRRGSLRGRLRLIASVLLLASLGAFTSGCSGKLPPRNPSYTPPGTYTYTVTASSGSLSHSATYMLTVTAK